MPSIIPRNVHHSLRVLGLVGVLLVLGSLATVARPVDDGPRLTPTTTIAEARLDANGDNIPDRMGDTLTVGGRVTASKGRLTVPVPDLAVLQDGTAGIHVLLPNGPVVTRGDSVQLRGVVEQAYGLTRLQGIHYRVVDDSTRVPAPLPLTVPTAAGERYEGRLAQVKGHIAAMGTNDGGDYLILEDPAEAASSQLRVFVGNRHLGRFDLSRFSEGDEIKVTGIIGQHDFEAPYSDFYQLEPRMQSDLAQIGWMPTYLRVALYVLAGGGLIAIVAVFLLRSAVQRRTRELSKSRARFRRLAEATIEGIALHEDDGKIVDANRALAEMVGLDREELIGRDIATVLPEPSVPPDEVNGEAGPPGEAEYVLENGTTSTPIEIEKRDVTAGHETMHVCAVRDISKRKKWENEILLAKQEAEQMAQLKSNLVNNMSHELRTPITNIKGYAEVIMEEAEEPHKNFASRIYESGERLAETLQSVLDMAQIEAGTLDVLIRDVVVANVVQEVVERHEQEIDDEVLTVEVDVPGDCVLQTDRTLLYRILNNLVQNAVKFTDEGTIGIDVEPMPDGIQLVVWDDGVGIDPEFRPHLFDPFKQESEGVARKYEGAGLGLSLTKRMVDILGGTIEVESVKGQGSAFTVELPSQSQGETPIVEGSEEYEVSLKSE